MTIVSGRWSVFFLEGEIITQIGQLAPLFTSGTYFHPDATTCERRIPQPRGTT